MVSDFAEPRQDSSPPSPGAGPEGIDAAEVRGALQVLADPGHTMELRGLPSGRSIVLGGGDLDGLVRAAAELGGGKGVYYTLNPLAIPAGERRAARDADVVRRRWLLIDIDPARPPDTNATDEEREAAHEQGRVILDWLCREQRWPLPLQVDSGNGWHLLYRIDLPNDADATALVKNALRRLSSLFSTGAAKLDVSVSNASRICRLPGTWNRKGDPTAERPHRMARLHHAPPSLDAVSAETIGRLLSVNEDDKKSGHEEGDSPRSASCATPARPDAAAYAEKALADECQAVASAQEGERNNTLNKAAFSVGQLVGAGALGEGEAEERLMQASRRCGLPHGEAAATIRSGMRAGMQQPRQLPPPCPVGRRQSGAAASSAARTAPPAERALRVRPFADLSMRPTRWLVPDFIPLGAVTTIAGDGGYGKSTLTLHLAASLSRGRPCFGLEYDAPPPRRVLLVGCEDSAEATVLPRLAAAGADLAHVLNVEDVEDVEGADATARTPFTLAPPAIAALERTCRALGEVGAVIIDPVSAFVPGAIDDHKDADVRAMLRPLAEMAERTGAAVVIVRHLNKSESGNAGNLVSGSRAYLNASRAAFLVGPFPDAADDDPRRVLVFCKRNLTMRSQGVAFQAVELTPQEQDEVLAMEQAAALTPEEGESLRGQLFRLEWLGETDVSARDFARARRGGETAGGRKAARQDRVERAGQWLQEYLANGPAPSDEVMARGKAEGFSRKILFEAKDAAGVRASNRGSYHGKWHWWVEAPAEELQPA